MNKLTLIAATATFAFAAAAHAGEATTQPAGKTRAEVRAELMQARADGSLEAWSETFNPYNASAAKRTAAPALIAQRPLPLVQPGAVSIVGEDSGSFALSPVPKRAEQTALAGR